MIYILWVGWGVIALIAQFAYIAAAPDIGGKIPVKLWAVPLAIGHILLTFAGIWFLFLGIGYLMWGDPYITFAIPEKASN